MSVEETAFAAPPAVEETRPVLIASVAHMLGRKTAIVERNPLPSTTKALIANLMAMR